ncbi:MAG: serine hydrolase [Acidimicrobiia bacterium]
MGRGPPAPSGRPGRRPLPRRTACDPMVPRAVTDLQLVTAAASSIYSTPRDMARYLATLSAGGTNEQGSVFKPETLATMFEPLYQPDPRVPGIGPGFFRIDLGRHPAVEHQGILPGLNSQIFVAPDDGVGVMAFTNGARRALMWLTAEAGRLLCHLVGARDEMIRTDVPHHPEMWGDICGWYQPRAQRTDLQVWSMVGAGAEVFVRHGRLMARALSPMPALYRGFLLHPDDEQDPYVFRIDLSEYGMGTGRVVFNRLPGVGTTSIHLDLAPLSLERRLASKNQRLWATGALGLATAAIAVRRGGATLR